MDDIERERFADYQMRLLGITPSNSRHYAAMRDAALRGWPAWRIAQAYDLSPKLIMQLGGPAPYQQ